MPGYLSLVLHAHLPFVRHPEHERFLEENWLFEATTESYVPLLQLLEGWQRDGLEARLTLTLTPTVCAMLQDPLLQARYRRYLDDLMALAKSETQRTHWEKPFYELAGFYFERFNAIRGFYLGCGGDLVGAFRKFQDEGRLEIITSAATHALLPLLAQHLPSLRAQILIARDYYRACFGQDPRGIWLPECAYVEGVETVLHEANLRWFVTDTHGLLHASPKPRYAMFAPIFTTNGIAAFGRDLDSAKQVWSRQEGYPGDPRYRDFYRDIGFDLDLDYLKRWLPAPGQRSFTGIKYYRITGPTDTKAVYERAAAIRAVAEHAAHFLGARIAQFQHLSQIFDRPPLVLSPYDAELFGHWWYEGPEFLDALVRQACGEQKGLSFITPSDYLRRHPTNQVATPAASSWGEEGYWRVWLNESNQWIYPHLRVAQERMTELARNAQAATPSAAGLPERALKQAGRELLLAQASDWPFILRTGTSPEYARKRVKEHLLRFTRLYEMLTSGVIDADGLARVEASDNLFPELEARYWL
ncbi:MAG TPA: 1,4-alpha-glucan branching protein domain-containing protein [Candidatus Binatia bacterium]|jgi:1,4-alpha-glucan branching enzyme|nr:1,4-alpha-glucan branching protein domain-containing protein [Candidatus Binatia bacterium]